MERELTTGSRQQRARWPTALQVCWKLEALLGAEVARLGRTLVLFFAGLWYRKGLTVLAVNVKEAEDVSSTALCNLVETLIGTRVVVASTVASRRGGRGMSGGGGPLATVTATAGGRGGRRVSRLGRSGPATAGTAAGRSSGIGVGGRCESSGGKDRKHEREELHLGTGLGVNSKS